MDQVDRTVYVLTGFEGYFIGVFKSPMRALKAVAKDMSIDASTQYDVHRLSLKPWACDTDAPVKTKWFVCEDGEPMQWYDVRETEVQA